MKSLRQFLDKARPSFERGGRFERFYPLFEATDTFLYSTDEVTAGQPHVRDSMDLKRIMIIVVWALTPCVLMAMWNTGFQANSAMQAIKMTSAPGWRGAVLTGLGIGYDPEVSRQTSFMEPFIFCRFTSSAWPLAAPGRSSSVLCAKKM